MTNYGKETIILFDEAQPTARVETFNGRLLREIERAANRCGEIITEEREENYGVVVIPKKFIKIHAPRTLSEKQMAVLNKLNAKKMI